MNLLMYFMSGIFFLILIILSLFFLSSKKSKFDILSGTTFECGFTSYFFSRFSFSLHYYLIGLIFLFLDLELCYLFPFFNEDFSSVVMIFYLWVFIFILILGLMEEWNKGLLDWKF